MSPPDAAVDAIDTETYLAHVVATTHEDGYVPASAVDAVPTWRAALERCRAGGLVTPAEVRRVHEIRGWAASLHPRDPKGYRARMAACVGQADLTARDLPLAASSVRAFNLHLYYGIRGRKSPRHEAKRPRHAAPPRAAAS